MEKVHILTLVLPVCVCENSFKIVTLSHSVSLLVGAVVLVGRVAKDLEVQLVVVVQLPDLGGGDLLEEVQSYGGGVNSRRGGLLTLLHLLRLVFVTLKAQQLDANWKKKSAKNEKIG